MNICTGCRKTKENCSCDDWIKETWEKRHKRSYDTRYFEIDDDIWPMIEILWAKGYSTNYCCSGHPDGLAQCYITFSGPYDFDFTTANFGEGWSYSRTSGCNLIFFVGPTIERKLKKRGIKPHEYLIEQRAVLLEWVKQLPEAKMVSRSKVLPGTGSRGKIIPAEPL